MGVSTAATVADFAVRPPAPFFASGQLMDSLGGDLGGPPGTKKEWSGREDLNLQPSGPEPEFQKFLPTAENGGWEVLCFSFNARDRARRLW